MPEALAVPATAPLHPEAEVSAVQGDRLAQADAGANGKGSMRILDLLPARIARRILVTDGCWGWAGWHNTEGYGYVHWEGRDQPVHRVLYEVANGVKLPRGIDVDHVVCHDPGCCNPGHGEAVTHRENIKRGRAGSKQTCNYGHDWTIPRNVYVRKNGARCCAECARQRGNAKYHARRVA